MHRGSWSVGRLFGTAVRVHWTALATVVALVVILHDEFGVAATALAVAAFFFSVLAHEAAHAAAAKRFGIATESIELWALGGLARLAKHPATPRAEGWIAAAGPLANIAIGSVAAGGGWLLHNADAGELITFGTIWLATINLAIGLFNLLPGSPLDGGRIVRAVRWAHHGRRYQAMREAGTLGIVLGGAMVIFGLSWTLQGNSGIWLIISGVFVLLSARVETVTASLGERLGPIRVGELTWFGVAETSPDMDVDAMLWQRTRLGGAGAVAVRNDDGHLDGLVLEDQLWAVPASLRADTLVATLLAPFERLPRADVDDELAIVLPTVNPLRPVIAVWGGDRLLGVVPPDVLRERIVALTDQR